ncbi:hypothetical protein PN36_10355 [Candidatus Thiomargarita nelsonii]|uniref:Polymorphic outer membrane protein n=1 Tax=Candidatus Thiomargarita nelsonii TaxID=1003181 RepID=A0A4E0QRG2_9GAMM|nr:hypothetical protein PN36_10355 [Candidatus Thiomargarita nelsonii]
MKKTLKNKKLQEAVPISRRNQPHAKRILPLMLSSVLGAMPMAQAATINVGGGCSLVDAITAANSDTATGGCSAGSGADTIELESSTIYTLTVANNNDDSDNGLPSITSEITINGNGSTISRDGMAPDFRILYVAETIGELTLNELTIQNGYITEDDPFLPLKDFVGSGILNRGTLTINNSTVSGNHIRNTSTFDGVPTNGGGIWNSGTLTLNYTVVMGNSAFFKYLDVGMRTDNESGSGGGIWNSGILTLSNSTVMGNQTHESGGGIWNSGTLMLINSTVEDNSASGDYSYHSSHFDTYRDVRNVGSGGGIWNSGALTLLDSIIINNKTDNGGGGILNGGTVTLSNSSIAGNSAFGNDYRYYDRHYDGSGSSRTDDQDTGSGGGISNSGTLTLTNSTVEGNEANSKGGGISSDGTLTLLNSTIAGNSAFGNYYHFFRDKTHYPFTESEEQGTIGSGGGISNSGTLTLTNSTVAGNDVNSTGGGIKNSNSMTLLNSIIANSLNGGDCINEGTLSSTNNLIEDGTCSSAFSPGTDPNLGPLQDNGGPTQTYALLTGSPAIDAGTNDGCPNTDQRGVTRHGTCDIGAYEYQGIPTYVDLLSLTATGSYHPEFNLYYADIQWETGLEIDSSHFEILKSAEPEGPYQAIRIWYYDGQYYQTERISAQGEGWKYRVFDPFVPAGETYYYQLKEVDIYGISTEYGPVFATMPNP